MIRGNHSFKFGGEVSYEKIVHDTLLDNYGVFSFNGSKTGQRLRRLPARPAGDDDAGRAGAKDGQRRLHQPVRAGRLPRPPARDAEPRRPLRPAVPVHRSAGPQARVRARRRSRQVSPTAPEGLLFPGDPGISRGIVKTDKNNIAPRLGIAWDPKGDGRMAVRAGAGIFYGSITGNEWNTTADNQPFTVRQSFPTVFTLSDPYRNLPGGVGAVPVQLRSGEPALHAAGAGLRPVARLRVAVHLPDEPDRREGDPPQLQRERLVRRGARAGSCRRASTGTIPCSVRGRPTANVNARRPYQPGVIGAARVLESIFNSDYHAPAAQRRAARQPLLGQGVLHVRQGDRGRRLPGRRAAGGAELEPHRAGARAARPPIARTASCSPASGGSTTSERFARGRQGAAERLDGLGHRHAAERHAAHDPLRPGPQLRRAHQRSRRHHRRSRSSISGRPRDELIEQWFNIAAFAQPAHRHRRHAPAAASSTGPGYRNVDLGVFRDIRLAAARCCSSGSRRRTCSTSSTCRIPGTEPQRAGDVRQDPHRAGHAEDSAGRARVVLKGAAREQFREGGLRPPCSRRWREPMRPSNAMGARAPLRQRQRPACPAGSSPSAGRGRRHRRPRADRLRRP